MATHSTNVFLLVDSCAGSCPKIIIGPSSRPNDFVLPQDPTSKTIKTPATTNAELEKGRTVSLAPKGTTATNSAPVFWVGPSKEVSSSAVPARKPGQRVPTVSKELSDCDAGGAGGCLGTVSGSIHPLRLTKGTLGVHVVVNQTIVVIIKNVRSDCLCLCLDCDAVLGVDSAAREKTAPTRLTGRVKIRNGFCLYGYFGELIHGTACGMVEPTTPTDRGVGNPGMIEKIGLSMHSANRVNSIEQIAEVVSKIGAEKQTNLLRPSSKR